MKNMAEAARAEVLNLMNKKAQIEEEIKAMGLILTQNGVGMTEPLVDSEGYPLANIDVYQVRIARNRIICLQNDYKALLKEIEKGLSEYYGTRTNLTESHNEYPMNLESAPRENLRAFAKVNDVSEGSPADEAGLRNDDHITEFGSVNINNFKDMNMIANVVKHSENKELAVIIERGNRVLNIKLRPKKWSGRGLLGCNIAPLEFVDR